MPISTESCLTPTADAQVKPLDDCGVIVDTRTGKCWELNAVGFAIWQLIAAGQSIGETVKALASRYSISIAASTNDVTTFVQALMREGLLEVLPAAGGSTAAR